LCDDVIAGLDLSIAADGYHRKPLGDESRQLGIEWPPLGAPCAPRCERDEWFADSRACQELVNYAALILAGIQTWPELLSAEWICAIAERQRQQSLGVMLVWLVPNALCVERAPSRSIKAYPMRNTCGERERRASQ